MPIQAPPWTDFLSCPICCNEFAINQRVPISLGCGHTICRLCLTTLHNRQCPFDQTTIVTDVDSLPINNALLQLVSNGSGGGSGRGSDNVDEANCDIELAGIDQNTPQSVRNLSPDDLKSYLIGKKCIEDLALHLKCFLNNGNLLTRPMQRKLVTLVNCQLMEEEGRVRALRAARSLGDRTVTELILQHQNPQQLSSNLWAAVRSRGCQFLGPAMQELVLKLVLLALEDGSALSRKVLVMFVVQRLETKFPQASKTSIGHVVQLLYRASCFKVSKREADSSLMQLKEEFRTYDALRREHDAQIVQIATEAGLRIAPDQWSSLLYGDIAHKSHMQSIMDKLQTPSSFAQSVQELVIALQRTTDPANLANLHDHFKYLASIDPCVEVASWSEVGKALHAVHQAVVGLVQFLQHFGNRKSQDTTGVGQLNSNSKYKISLCRDLTVRRMCPRGSSCTFAHSEEELERFRAKNRGKQLKHTTCCVLKPIQMGNPKKHLHPGEERNSPNKSLLPVSPMRYVGPPPPNAGSRTYMDPSIGLQQHQVSPGAARQQPHGFSTHHSQVSPQHAPHNGVLMGTPFDNRFNNSNNNNNNMNYMQTPVSTMGSMQSPLRSRDFMTLPPPSLQQPLVHQRNLTTANPPSFKANNNINNNNNSNNPSHSLSNIPDIYMNSNVFFGKRATSNHLTGNDIDQAAHPSGNQLWEQGFQQLPPTSPLGSSKIHQMNLLGSTTNQNPNRTSSTISKIPNTSYFVKKPPNSKDLNKGMSELSLGASALRKNSNYEIQDNAHFWKNALSGHNSSKVDQMELVKNAYRDRDSFVRSDSILDDDATTFDVPPSLSIQSQFGPICPKYKGNTTTSLTPTGSMQTNRLLDSWVNSNDLHDKQDLIHDDHALLSGDQNYPVFLHANDNHMTLNMPSLQTGTKMTQSAHPELAKFQKLSDIDLSVTMPGKRTQIPTNNINNNMNNINKATSVGDTAAVLWANGMKPHGQNLVHLNNVWSSADSDAASGQFKPQQFSTVRKSHLTTEDSFDGGIDSGMMRDLEQKLVEIVDKVSIADDSGIKMD